jgi:mono/diheme cytochrome c family protein
MTCNHERNPPGARVNSLREPLNSRRVAEHAIRMGGRMGARLALLFALVTLAGCRPGAQLDGRLGGPVVQRAGTPAISGGTLEVLADGATAIVADPDRDRVLVVDLPSRTVERELSLPSGSEPGRVAEDRAGRVHVVLRGTGELATFEAHTGDVSLRHACSMPRGVAYDASTDEMLVACRTGELVSLPAGGGEATRTVMIEPDLRDVLVVAGRRFVTTFRTAHLIEVSAEGTPSPNVRAPDELSIDGGGAAPDRYSPSVAWRAIVVPGTTTIAMVHQRGRLTSIPVHTAPSMPVVRNGYGAPSTSAVVTCRSSVVHGAVTFFPLDGATISGQAIPQAVLPVDLAAHGDVVTLVAAGNQAGARSLITATEADLTSFAADDGCAHVDDRGSANVPTAIDFDGAGELVVLERDPSVLVVGGDRIALGGASVFDTGQAIFHGNPGELVACASCHPEGGEDGRTWTFDGIPRRTQSIGGTISATAPFHWDGGEASFDALVADVFVTRMRGPALSGEQTTALGGWIDAIPTPHAPVADTDAVARGQVLFEGAANCASCHSGEHFTNDETTDVGTGGAFQVPSLLGVSHRLPVMHDGCATTLEMRFLPSCGGSAHGNVDALDAADQRDLIAYLRSL